MYVMDEGPYTSLKVNLIEKYGNVWLMGVSQIKYENIFNIIFTVKPF